MRALKAMRRQSTLVSPLAERARIPPFVLEQGAAANAQTQETEQAERSKKDQLARDLRLRRPEESMERLLEVMERSSGLFRASSDHAIPEVRYSQIENGTFPVYVSRQINRRGVVVVREAVPRQTALRWRDQLLEYILRNKKWTKPPVLHNLFYSAAQQEARQHTRLHSVLAALNKLWHADADVRIDLTRSLGYCDRVFVGKPCSPSGHSGPVMLGGGLQRWTDPAYQRLYERIFAGRPEDWDPFRADFRVALAERIGGGKSQGFLPFRPFQGFLSLASGEDGAMRVAPMMRVATAFMLLRPFMSDVSDDDMCGAQADAACLQLSRRYHQPIYDALVRLPPLAPGDAVFMHADIAHCEGELRSEVDRDYVGMLLSSMPVCPGNSAYLRAQRSCFDKFAPPPAFGSRGGFIGETADPAVTVVTDVTDVADVSSSAAGVVSAVARNGSTAEVSVSEESFFGRGQVENMTELGLQALGLGSFRKEHHNDALAQHHKLLGLQYKW